MATLALAIAAATVCRAGEQLKTTIVPQIPHSDYVSSVAFSPDGKQALTGSIDGTAKLWDVATGQLTHTFEGHSTDGKSSTVTFSRDGEKVLIGSYDKTAKLWDAATGQIVRTFEGHSLNVTSVAFAPDGRHILTGSHDKTAKLWDVATGRTIRTFEGHSGDIDSVAFSLDGGQILTGSDDKLAKLWDVSTGQILRTFEGSSSEITSVAFSPIGKQVLTGCRDSTAKLWDAATGQILRNFEGHSGEVTSVTFSPNGRHVLTGSYDKTAKLWDAATGQVSRTYEHLLGVTSVTFSPDGRQILTAILDNKAQLWNAANGQIIQSFQGYVEAVTSVAFSPDGEQALTGSRDTSAKLWDAATGQVVRTFEGHSGEVTSVTFSPNGRHILTGSHDKTAKLWDVATGRTIRTFEGHSGYIDSVAFSPDGRHVITGSHDDTAKLWDAATGQIVHTFQGHSGYVSSVAFSPNGKQILTGSWDSTVKLWNATTGRIIRTFEHKFGISTSIEGHLAPVSSVAFAPDGKHVVTGSWDATAKLWDVATGKIVQTLQASADAVTSVVFSPDGKQVLMAVINNSAKLWDTEKNQIIRTFEGHSNAVSSVAFSPDGKQALTGSNDATARIWRIGNEELIGTFISSRDGKWLALTPEGFFHASSPKAGELLAVVRGVDPYRVDQMWQSLYAPDLVRERLAGDPEGEVARAAEVMDLDRVVTSGQAPEVTITSPTHGTNSPDEIVTAKATITRQQDGGIGRVEWRVNGITAGVSNPPPGAGPTIVLKQSLALDAGENTIEVVAYNGRNLLASLPVKTTITLTAAVTAKPKLHVLAIGINKYIDNGSIVPSTRSAQRFAPLYLAVSDAKALAEELNRAGQKLYASVYVRTALDEQATLANLDAIVTQMATQIEPRDTFVLYAATHGYSHQGRFYLIPQDYQGGPDPQALATKAVDQQKLQDWIANRVKAKKALILLDSCESGALTAGYARSRFDSSASDAAVGRLHEATGRPVLTAAGLGQSALELSELGHGVFTSALIDSFYRGDANGDGLVSVAELVSYVRDLVPRLIRDPKARAQVIHRGSQSSVQSARFGGRGEDFPFVRRLQ